MLRPKPVGNGPQHQEDATSEQPVVGQLVARLFRVGEDRTGPREGSGLEGVENGCSLLLNTTPPPKPRRVLPM